MPHAGIDHRQPAFIGGSNHFGVADRPARLDDRSRPGSGGGNPGYPNAWVRLTRDAAELARARKLLAKGEDVDAVLEALARGMSQKMLHGAMAELHAGDASARERASYAIQHFFLRNGR
jgi:hypothetical protein